MASLKKRQLLLGALILAALGTGFWINFRTSAEMSKQTPVSKTPDVVPQPQQVPATVTTSAESKGENRPLVASDLAQSQPTSASVAQPAPALQYTPTAAPIQRPATAVAQPIEVRATRAMYMAHAPLRVHAVADPDSEANRQILQTMVEKALSRQEAAR